MNSPCVQSTSKVEGYRYVCNGLLLHPYRWVANQRSPGCHSVIGGVATTSIFMALSLLAVKRAYGCIKNSTGKHRAVQTGWDEGEPPPEEGTWHAFCVVVDWAGGQTAGEAGQKRRGPDALQPF